MFRAHECNEKVSKNVLPSTMINSDFEYVRDSPKVNTFYTMTSDKVYSYFLFLEQKTVILLDLRFSRH
jgi:hypothetical protein